jgi:RNA-directed DNA polymerase
MEYKSLPSLFMKKRGKGFIFILTVLAGWVEYFRVGNSSRAFSEVRDYLEMKIRTLLTRRKRRQKRSVGWRQWSTEYL